MKLLERLNRAIVLLSAIALLVASCVLTYSVVLRYFSPQPTDWQDEFSVFLLIGATFMSAAWVQSQRGHIGIEAVATLLPPAADRWRLRAGRCGERPVLRLLRLEILDAAARGLGRRLCQLLVVGAAAVDPLSADVARHVRC